MPGVLGVFTGPGSRRRRPRRDSAGRQRHRARRQADVCGRHAGAGTSTASAMSANPLRSSSPQTLAQAQDAAETRRRRCQRTCRCASDVESAIADGAAAIHEPGPGNIALDWSDGDGHAVDAAFANAAHVERVRLADTRLAPVSMEPRAGIGLWDDDHAALHPDRQHAGRRGGAQAARRGRLQGAAVDHPRADPRCRRRLRHEGADAIRNTARSCTRRARSAGR